MMTHFVLTDKGCFDGVYQVKDQVKIEGKTYYRIGKDGMNDMVVNVDGSVITWDLAIDTTKEWFIEDTIEQLIADKELKRGHITIEYVIDTSRSKSEIVQELFDMSKIVNLDLNRERDLELYTRFASHISYDELVLAYDADMNISDYTGILKMLTACRLCIKEVDELSEYYLEDMIEDETLVDDLIKLWLANKIK